MSGAKHCIAIPSTELTANAPAIGATYTCALTDSDNLSKHQTNYASNPLANDSTKPRAKSCSSTAPNGCPYANSYS